MARLMLIGLAIVAPAAVWSLQQTMKPTGSNSMCSLLEETSVELMGAERQTTHSIKNCNSFGMSQVQRGMVGIDYLSMFNREDEGANKTKEQQMAVWVSGYPRSGSSTVLSMVSATVDDNRDAGEIFSLFEPCHGGDEYTPAKEKEGCNGVLEGIAKCDFDGIKTLWGWADPHSTNDHDKFTAAKAEDVCSKSDVVAFKTVDYGHDLGNWTWLLDSHPKMKVLDVVRDPRGIYASWVALEPFATLVKQGDFYTLTEVCDHFAANIDFHDRRIHRIVFEDLMKDPAKITKQAYKFLGLNFGGHQQKWIKKAFNVKWCPPPPPGMEGFTDCHTNSTGSIDKWRTVLTKAQLKAFDESESCQRVVKVYGYPPN